MKTSRTQNICSTLCIFVLSSGMAMSSSPIIQIERYAPVLSANDTYARDIVKLNYEQLVAGNALQFSSSYGETDSQITMQFGTSESEFMYFRGNGEGYNQLDQGSLDLDPYFFHGGNFYNYRYQGISSEFSTSLNTKIQFGYNKVASGDLDQRSAWYSGISHKNFSAGAMLAYRKNDPTANGYVFSRNGKLGETNFQEIHHESGARYRSFSWRRDNTNRWYDLSFQSGRNPLYLVNNENRIMFRFGGDLGKQHIALSATDSSTPEVSTPEESQPKKKNRGGTAVVAGLVIGVAVASSSGDDELDNRIRLPRQRDAGFIALNNINPVSVRQNREHGGWVYRNGDGTFGYTDPVPGDVDSVDIGNPGAVIPRGTAETASYHTHGGPDPRFDNENFSPQDILTDSIFGVDGYLGTPAGQLKFHNLRRGTVTTIGRIAN